VEKFKLKDLNEVEGKVQYRVKISNMFAVLVSSACETIRKNIKISAKGSPCYFEFKKRRILKIIRSKEQAKFAVVIGSE
jgi:hypothetical protein